MKSVLSALILQHFGPGRVTAYDET